MDIEPKQPRPVPGPGENAQPESRDSGGLIDLAATVHYLYISPGHNFFGRYGKGSLDHETVSVQEVECVAGSGLVGDRFFDYKPDYKGQVTLFSLEVFMTICGILEVWAHEPGVLRRNVVVSGAELNDLIGRRFVLQGVEFEGIEEAKPCLWMDEAFAPGAEALLVGRGGLRAKVRSNGRLRVDGDGCLS